MMVLVNKSVEIGGTDRLKLQRTVVLLINLNEMFTSQKCGVCLKPDIHWFLT